MTRIPIFGEPLSPEQRAQEDQASGAKPPAASSTPQQQTPRVAPGAGSAAGGFGAPAGIEGGARLRTPPPTARPLFEAPPGGSQRLAEEVRRMEAEEGPAPAPTSVWNAAPPPEPFKSQQWMYASSPTVAWAVRLQVAAMTAGIFGAAVVVWAPLATILGGLTGLTGTLLLTAAAMATGAAVGLAGLFAFGKLGNAAANRWLRQAHEAAEPPRESRFRSFIRKPAGKAVVGGALGLAAAVLPGIGWIGGLLAGAALGLANGLLDNVKSERAKSTAKLTLNGWAAGTALYLVAAASNPLTAASFIVMPFIGAGLGLAFGLLRGQRPWLR